MRKLTKNLKIAFLIFLSGILFFSLANAVTVSHKKTPKVKAENLIAYNQMDSRWKNLTHGNYSGDTTIGSNGCGILSLVNAINYYNAISDVKGAIDEIATCASGSEYGNAYNTTSSGDGMIGSWFYPKLPGSKLGNKYGIYSVGTVFHEGKSTDSTLKNHCAVRGQFAIVNVLYHYIAVVEYDATTDKYLVLNSSQGYSANGTSTPENGGVKWYATSELNGALTAGMSIRSYSLLAIKINDNSNRENTVLGKASTGWDTTKLYDYSSENFDDREVLLNSSAFTGDNEINFVQSNSPKIEVGATFEVVDKLKSELWGKFGISFIGADGVGILFYANAQGTTGNNLESVTGTSVGYVLRNPAEYTDNNYAWGTEKEFENVWNSRKISLKIVRQNAGFYFYANDVLITKVLGTDFGISPDDYIFPQIRSFNVGVKVTEYYSAPSHNSLTIDGKLSDWQTLDNWQKIQDNKQEIADTKTQKRATFYSRLTRVGLFLYAEAIHFKNSIGQEDWTKNTNFEIYINSDKEINQFYATSALTHGFTSAYFKTTQENGNYKSILEAFISTSALKSLQYDGKSLNIGFAFKVDDNGDNVDYITTKSGTQTSYWVTGDKEPQNLPHTISAEADFTKSYDILGTRNWFKDGEKLKLSAVTSNDALYFEGDKDNFNHNFKATFKITSKLKTEEFPKVGLGYVDQWGDGFFFYADAEAEGADDTTEISAITGTKFGVVWMDNGVCYWDKDLTVKELVGATFDVNKPFDMKIVRKDNSFSLYAQGVLLTTLTGDDYLIRVNQLCYPSIRSFNLFYEVTNYGIEYPVIDNLLVDADLSDWEKLDNWQEISSNAPFITDAIDTQKGAWFYARLTKNGLHLAVKAHHKVHSTGYWIDWWRDTNVEFFIGEGSFNNQLYATEFLRKGFTYSAFKTTGTANDYTTIFEGFIEYELLTNYAQLNDGKIKIGYAFKVDNLESSPTKDTITPEGEDTPTSYWRAGNIDPLFVPFTVCMETETPLPPTPPISSSDSDKSSSDSSKIESSSSSSFSSSSDYDSSLPDSSSNKCSSSHLDNSSFNSQESSNTCKNTSSKQENTSSSTQIKSSVSQKSSSSQEKKTESKGCKGNLKSSAIFIVFAFLAVVLFVKKKNG